MSTAAKSVHYSAGVDEFAPEGGQSARIAWMREPRGVAWRRITESQPGLISRSQFINAGIRPNAVTHMAAQGALGQRRLADVRPP